MAPPDIQELLGRFPRTFGPALSAQIRGWDLLFPAEQRRLRAQLDHVASLKPDLARALFEPVVQLESRMNLRGFDPASVQQVSLLTRSPLYPQWRAEVERVFARIDEGAGSALLDFHRLLICELPAGLPYEGAALWPELAGQGRWVNLGRPFSEWRQALAEALSKRALPAALEPIESAWAVNASSAAPPVARVLLDWEQLAPLRREFSSRLNSIRRDLKDVDATNEDLRRTSIDRFIPAPVAAEPRIREFIRAVLLAGNGALIFPSSFVQWTASEAIRRAQPQVLYASFGLRQKLKPFSSLVLFEDQTRANPTAEENDPAGSLTDAQMLARYVYLSAQRILPAPQSRLIAILGAAPLTRILVLGPDIEPAAPALGDWLSLPVPARSIVEQPERPPPD